MYIDENKSSVLAKVMNPFDYVIIDTCSLMDEAFPEWMDVLQNAKEYRKKGQQILVPRRCFEELKKHADQEEDDSKRIDAKRGLKILRHDKWFTHLLTITKEVKNENFADNAIYVKVCADRLFSKILIITQDKSLASDLRALNSLKSQNGRPLAVFKIVAGGTLAENLGETATNRERKGRSAPSESRSKPQPKAEPTTEKELLAADQRLSANLSNSNYPAEKKRADVQAQIKALEKLTVAARTNMPLVLSLPMLRRYLTTGTLRDEKPAKPAEKPAKPQPKVENQPKTAESIKPAEAPKTSAEPAKKLPSPVKEEKAADRLWYGAGKTFKDAVLDCADHYHILFHDPSVVYFPQAHGPFDLDTNDIDGIVNAGLAVMAEEKVAFAYKDIPMWCQKVNEERYKCWIDVNFKPVVEEPKPTKAKKAKASPAEAPKTEPAPAEKQQKPKAKKAAEQPVTKEAGEKKAPTKAKAKATKKAEAATEKPVEEVEATQPKKAKAKKAEPKQEAPKAEEKNEAPKAKKPAKKKEKPAKPAETVEEAVVSPNFKKAHDADRRLRAVLPNPNYPIADKVKDIKAQRTLLLDLSESEVQTLKYGPKEIEAWLKEHETEGQGNPEGGE